MQNGDRKLDDVLHLVEAHVAKNQPRRFRLVVKADGARSDENWWYILVQPDREGVPSYEYSEQLTRIEDEIRDAEGVNVLLVPVLT